MSLSFNSEQLQLVLKGLKPKQEFYVAYSGGVDSHVLLHALVQLRDQKLIKSVTAMHVHHGYSAQADSWAQHCQKICADLAVPFILKKIQVKPQKKESWEAVARTLRYQVLAEELNQNSCLVTGHTQTDQAETVLLQLLRGAGVKGLAAMPLQINKAYYNLLRPLLNFTRAQIVAYAQEQQLQWIEDESNSDERFMRNYLRHRVFPLLQQRWVGFESVLARTATNFAEADELLAELAKQDLAAVQGSVPNTLSVQKLIQLNEIRQRNVIRYWLSQQKFLLPEHRKLLQLQKDLLLARVDTTPKISWGNVEVARFKDDLYAFIKTKNVPDDWQVTWDLKSDLELPNQLGMLRASQQKNSGLLLDKNGEVTVRFRRGGEKIRLLNRKGSHSLKKLFQEWGVPVWQRDKIPLIWLKEELICVVGYAIAGKYMAKENEVGNIISHQ